MNTNKTIKYLLVFSAILSCLFYSCIDEIEYSSEKQDLGINISGQFTNVLEDQKVVIRKALDVNAESTIVGDPIEDAIVKVISSTGVEMTLEYKGKGEYSSFDKGETGTEYKIHVMTVDGEIYESDFEEMPTSIPLLDNSGLLKDETVEVTNGIISTVPRITYVMSTRLHDGNGPVYAMFRALGEYEFSERQTAFGNAIEDSKVCYITDNSDLGNVFTLSGFDLPNNEALDREIFQIDYDWRFELNYCLHVEQLVINENTYDYWNRVGQLVEESSLFDPPPGRIFGNINAQNPENEVVVRGFFTIAGKSERRAFLNSGDLQRPVDNICLAAIRAGQRDNSALPDFCVDCLKARNSTVVKPVYWPE